MIQTKTQVQEDSRWHLDANPKEASAKEWQSYRLNSYIERLQLFLQKEIKPVLSFEDITPKYISKDVKYEAAHLRIGHGVIKPVVLTVGDPFRCEVVAKLCDKYEEIAWNREYRIFNIVFEGAEMSVVSHGIGGPGAAICFEELIMLGVTTIIRMGTCGSMKKEIVTGDLIVNMAAIREDGHSNYIMP